MKRNKMRFGYGLLTAATVLAGSTQAMALTAIGGADIGAFTGTIDYSFTDSTTAQLVIELTNTSPVANGGFITAFVFNNPGGLITGASLLATDADFGLLGLDDDGVGGEPFGQFDVGASTGGGFQGGGNPSKGIAVGDTETFTFTFTGASLDTLSDASFLGALSSPPGSGEGLEDFVVRFRGFEDDDSDKVPNGEDGTIDPGGDPDPSVPEPVTASLGILSLGALAMATRRRR